MTGPVGVVLRDSIVIDLAAANREYETKNAAATKVPAPSDMKDLIVRYDTGVSQRIKQIVAGLVAAKQLDGTARPAYVRNVSAVKTLPPIIYPGKSLNAAANYYGHAGETGTPEEQKKEADARRKDRGAPYLVLTAMEGAVIGDGDDILMPRGRERIDWECELAVVIGKKAKYVSAADAKDYIFGYTIELDMSDRGGRPGKEPRFGGSDCSRQEPRHVRPDGTLDRPEGVLPRSDERRPEADGERERHAGLALDRHDSQHLRSDRIQHVDPDDVPRRRHCLGQPGRHRHVAKRAAGADLAEAGRQDRGVVEGSATMRQR